jgi:hypothetical protein
MPALFKLPPAPVLFYISFIKDLQGLQRAYVLQVQILMLPDPASRPEGGQYISCVHFMTVYAKVFPVAPVSRIVLWS